MKIKEQVVSQFYAKYYYSTACKGQCKQWMQVREAQVQRYRVCLVARVDYLTPYKLSVAMPTTYKCGFLCCVW
jgi:hypothetical protein